MSASDQPIVMTPRLVGEMIDNLAGGDPASIVAAGLSMLVDDQVMCKIQGFENEVCVIKVYGNLASRIDELGDFVMAIPTSDNEGDYNPGFYRFRQCEFWVMAKLVSRSS